MAMQALAKLVRQLKALLHGLGLAEDTESDLANAEQLLHSHLKRLGGIRTRMQSRLKQVCQPVRFSGGQGWA